MEKLKVTRDTNFLDKQQTLTATVHPSYFKHLHTIISDTISYLEHVREVTPNPTLLDRHLRNLVAFETELARAIEADKFIMSQK